MSESDLKVSISLFMLIILCSICDKQTFILDKYRLYIFKKTNIYNTKL